MKLTFISILIIAILCSSFKVNNDRIHTKEWSDTGHRVVGEIANKYLKHRTKRKIKKLLKGKSLAFVSTYADEIKSDKRYNEFYSWHFINIPLDGDYESSKKNPDGDLATGIKHCKKLILNKDSSEADKIFYLKMLVHLIGDLHQPMHIGLEEDRGGNDFKVQWHYKDSNMHRVWDSEMINQFNMGYIELAENADILTKTEINNIQQGSVIDWVNETHELTRNVYANVTVGDNLRYEYSYENFQIVRNQLQIAGIRLAKVLNDIL